MSEIIYTSTNSGNDSKGKFLGLSGNNYMIPLVSGFISFVVYMILSHALEVNTCTAILISSIPTTLSILFLIFFKEGKPAGYAFDYFENIVLGANWSYTAKNQPLHPKLVND